MSTQGDTEAMPELKADKDEPAPGSLFLSPKQATDET
jgi:hypothetical protein